ncbi:MAG: MutS-related protein [Acidimicrobiales bacterium]
MQVLRHRAARSRTGPGGHRLSGPASAASPPACPFHGLLSGAPSEGTGGGGDEDRTFAADLNLDQIVEAVAGDREERDLVTELLYMRLEDADGVAYRHEVFRDLEDPGLLGRLQGFSEAMHQVRAHLVELEEMPHRHQRAGWFLDAVALYCDAVASLADDLAATQLRSRALLAFRDFLAGHVGSSGFIALAGETRAQKEALSRVRYCVRIRGGRVDVTRYEGEEDYSAEVLETFERFKQGAVKDYRVQFRARPGMTHVGGQILDLVARLFSAEISALEEHCRRHAAFVDETVARFERELQLYLAYLEHIAPLRSAGLAFCYPEVTARSKESFATETFDLALARKLVGEGRPVVRNDFHLADPERVLVVSGPNQGGKTTFARTFGQLHHLAAVGCPVPGRSARLFLGDRILTHFGREEDLSRMSGRLEDDLVRVRDILLGATPRSIVIMNETFTSTTLSDALFLGKKVMEKVMELDLLCVYVTFVDELASLGDSVVSMVSTIVPGNPAERTYKVIRGPADGLAYALAIAERHGVTYERLRRRLSP